MSKLLKKSDKTQDYIFNGHAGAGPSSASRWLDCTASLEATRQFLETRSEAELELIAVPSLAAQQGTTAHAAAEIELRGVLGELTPEEVKTALDELKEQRQETAYSHQMADDLHEYIDLVSDYINSGREVLLESKVKARIRKPSGGVHFVKGSADCIVLPSEKVRELVVADLKYGSGVDVQAEENEQIRLYALGAAALAPKGSIDTVQYIIAQPRAGGIKTWSEPLSSLVAWRESIAPRVEAALDGVGGGAEFKPSESNCMFCPARQVCVPFIEDSVAQSKELFDELDEAEVAQKEKPFAIEKLDDRRLAYLLVQALAATKLAEELKKEAQHRMERGAELNGLKLVNYTPPRKWSKGTEEKILSGEIAMTDEQREAIFTRKIKTPKIVVDETLRGDTDLAAYLQDFIEYPEPKPVVALENDRRKEWKPLTPEQMFE